MQNDNFYQYVKEYLEGKLDYDTVKEMHIFANINLQRRVSKAESSIYKKEPMRDFFIGDKESEDIELIYEDMDVNTCLKRANEAYKYQDQCCIQIYPEENKLKPRVLLPHHYDVIPSHKDPEKAFAYIISNFDNTTRDKIRRDDNSTGFSQGDKYRDMTNQAIADYDDPKLKHERYYVWTDELNFVMNGRGEILDKETQQVLESFIDNDPNIMSPLAEFGCLPFVDISKAKDFEYWVRSGDSLYDATIMYNVILTSEYQTVEMQGHAQPYYKGDAEHMPENIRVGVDKMIFIPVNPNNEVSSEFGFANTGADLGGVREFRESFLSAFLSSRGLDTSIISGSPTTSTASSGIEKLLQMIEKFEASQEDFSMFAKVENRMLEIISCWIASYRGERFNGELLLSDIYQVQFSDPSDVTLSLEYAKPEIIKTDMELLDIAQKEIEMGLSSRVHALMEYRNLTMEQAVKRIKEIDQLELGSDLNDGNIQAKVLEE